MASDWAKQRLEQMQSNKNQGQEGLGFSSTAQPAPSQAALQPRVVTQPAVETQPERATSFSQNQDRRRKFLEGNIVDKALDVAQAPMYATAGFTKAAMQHAKSRGVIDKPFITKPREFLGAIKAGVENIPSSVVNRVEFGRGKGEYNIAEEAGISNPAAQTAVNFAASLLSPSLPVAKIPGIKQAGRAIRAAGGALADKVRQMEGASKVIENIVPHFRNPEFGRLLSEAEERSSRRLNALYDMIKTQTKNLSPAQQARVGQLLEGGVSASGKYDDIVQAIRKVSDEIGQEAVDLGLMTPEQFAKYRGKYMSHIWNTLSGEEGRGIARKTIPTISGQFYKSRKGAQGYVREFAPAVFKGLGTQIKDVEAARFYKNIADKYAKSEINPEDVNRFVEASSITNARMRSFFQDKLVPKEVAQYLNEIAKTKDHGILDTVHDFWKKGKTIYNPAYHVRNFISNQILSDMSTGKGVTRSTIGFIESIRDLVKNQNNPFVSKAKEIGLIKRKLFGELFDETLESAGLKSKERVNLLVRADRALREAQAFSEDAAKLNVFRTWVQNLAKNAGKTVNEALLDQTIVKAAKDKAEEAIFSPYKINEKERSMVKKLGIPFYSFVRQAVPFTIKTFAEHPERITRYDKLKTAIEGLSQDASETRPKYAKDFIRTPIKDKEGNFYYVDPQYIYPFGSFDETGISQGRLPFGLSFNPFITELFQQMTNKDLYFDKPIRTSNIDEVSSKQAIEHAARSLLPTVYSTIGVPITSLYGRFKTPVASGKLYGALTQQPDYAGRTRSRLSAIIDALGIKNSVLRKEDQDKWNMIDKREKIKQIQNERRRVLKDSRITPEDKRIYIEELNKEMREVLSSP